ncbi:MAG: thioesterase [Oscillospiraceae bacterium]|nr:thioesterase [Oscillospiraceae bacterium]
MKWSQEYKVHYYYTDYANVLKPAYIARYMQETAWNALKAWGPSPKYLNERNLAFILTKMSFVYHEEIFEDDIIQVETWANPPRTIIFPRNYRIFKGENLAVEAVSEWVLLGVKEKIIVRPADYKDILNAYDDEKPTFSVQKRFNMPEEMDGPAEYAVKYSDIDTNFHMNNTRYIDLICDNLYSDDETVSPESKKRLLSLDVNYIGEARFGQIIRISRAAAPSGPETKEHYMRAKIKGVEQNCFEAKCITANR